MVTELVLLLALWAFILLGVFMGENGPWGTFRSSGPRLAARVERNVSVGFSFYDRTKNSNVTWSAPAGQ